MTRDDIMRMAREAGISFDTIATRLRGDVVVWDAETDHLERFATLVAAAEREACAKVCEALVPFGPELALQKATAEDCAASIRARGETK